MNSNPIKLAVAAMNEERVAQASNAARRLVESILGLRESNRQSEIRIGKAREEINRIEDSVVTAEKVLGTPLPESLNPNQETIAKVIAEMNKEAQAGVEEDSSEQLRIITDHQAAIAENEKKLAELLKDLQGISPNLVTEDVASA